MTVHDQYTGSIGDSQPYRYVGELGYYTHYQDQNMDLLQLGVRFYDPQIGRFTQRDSVPIVSESSYSYCDGNPLIRVDPSGRFYNSTRCNELLKDILKAAEELRKPQHECAAENVGKDTRNHYKEAYEQKLPRLQELLRRWMKNCHDKGGGFEKCPEWVTELADRMEKARLAFIDPGIQDCTADVLLLLPIGKALGVAARAASTVSRGVCGLLKPLRCLRWAY